MTEASGLQHKAVIIDELPATVANSKEEFTSC